MDFRYPLPVTRSLWKIKCGGYSREIAPFAGINKKALEEKELPLHAQIEVRDYQNTFSFTSSTFQLYPLDTSVPQALEQSEKGELVLPKSKEPVIRRPDAYYVPGEELVIKIIQEL